MTVSSRRVRVSGLTSEAVRRRAYTLLEGLALDLLRDSPASGPCPHASADRLVGACETWGPAGPQRITGFPLLASKARSVRFWRAWLAPLHTREDL